MLKALDCFWRSALHIPATVTLCGSSARSLQIEPWRDADRPISQAATPPSSWYTSRDVAERERVSVFHRNWQLAGHIRQLPSAGSFVTGEVAGMPHLICRDASGSLRAFHNVCRHHAAIVAKGAGITEQFQCQYHGWRYGLDGRLLQAKRLKGIEGFRAADNGLVPLSVDTFGPFVFVAHQPADVSLASWLGAGGTWLLPRVSGDYRHISTRAYHLRCNWKVFVDNYLDGGYHVPIAHMDLASGLDMTSYKSELFKSMSIQSVLPADDASVRLTGSRDAAMYAFVYPNLMVNVYGPWIDTNVVVPISEDSCEVRFDWYLAAERAADAAFVEQSLAASHAVQLEDVALCEDVQRGLSSPAYDVGRYAPAVETPMHHFHQLLHGNLLRA